MKEGKTLRELDELLRDPLAIKALADYMSRAAAKFAASPKDFFIWEIVPLSIFANVPEGIFSCWIFMIRAGLPAEPHRHPNSHQLTMSLAGEGDLQIWNGAGWDSHRITSEAGSSLEDRWVSVPPNVWHQAVVKTDWVVLSFHTAAEDELIEEAFTETRSKRTYS